MNRIAILLGALLIVACGSSTAPTPKLTVTVTSPFTVQGHDTTVGGQVAYVCYGTMVAKASGGKPGEVATWGGGHANFVLTATGQTASNNFPAAAAYFYGNPDVPTGRQVDGEINAGWVGPFLFSQTFYYSTPEEKLDSAENSFILSVARLDAPGRACRTRLAAPVVNGHTLGAHLKPWGSGGRGFKSRRPDSLTHSLTSHCGVRLCATRAVVLRSCYE